MDGKWRKVVENALENAGRESPNEWVNGLSPSQSWPGLLSLRAFYNIFQFSLKF